MCSAETCAYGDAMPNVCDPETRLWNGDADANASVCQTESKRRTYVAPRSKRMETYGDDANLAVEHPERPCARMEACERNSVCQRDVNHAASVIRRAPGATLMQACDEIIK